jgi:predicted lipid-binding transport protein (Tim44 family)
MKFTRLIALVAASVAAITLSIGQAEASRVGGGKNSGKQQPNAMQRDGGAPAGQQAAPGAQRPGQPAAAPAAQPQGNRWLGPLAGLAAGIGLAALASHLGFGEGLASIMMIVLFAVIALVVIRMIMARRSQSAQPQPAYAGAAAGQAPAQSPAASAQSGNTLFSPVSQPAAAPLAAGAGPVEATATSAASTGLRVPANFDIAGFVRNAKVQFIRLQASFDSGNLNDLREFTSPEMFGELRMQIEDRKGAANVTEVVSVEAEFLGVDSSDTEHMASVRFYGVIREAVGAPAQSFDEIWNLTKPVHGAGGWVLAGIQQNEAPAA